MAQKLDPSAYTVGWVCAIKDEVTASRAFLDEEYERPPRQPNDDNVYIVGRMGEHNVVIAFPGAGSYGADVIAQTVAHMVRTFQNIRFGLMVGIGGGAPRTPSSTDSLDDIRLGDIVVSEPKGNHGGVLQYDKGRWGGNGTFEIRSHLNQPPRTLLTAMELLQSDHELGFGKMIEYFDAVSKKSTRLKLWGFRFPGREMDRLYKPDHPHTNGKDCSACGTSGLVKRLERESDEPVVHYGLIASGNAVMRSAAYRDQLRDAWGACCFEMEAAGLMNEFPCLVIRGIADYSDDHKNDHWQRYAAAMAAAYAKDLLRVIQPQEVMGTEVALQIAGNLSRELNRVDTNVVKLTGMIEDDQTEELLSWLCPVDYRAEHSDFLGKRQPGTGQWLLNSDEFQDWHKTRGRSLLCQGIPGAGKTIMAATVIDYISTQQQENPDIALAFIYCNFRRQYQQRSIDLIASILKQLARQDHRLMQHLKVLNGRYKSMGTHPSTSEIINVLCAVEHGLKQTYVVIDALDEIQTPDKGLMGFLSELFRIQESTGLNILATSRFIPEIEKKFKEKGYALLEIRAVDEDVRSFIRGNLASLPDFVTESEAIVEKIQEEIARATNGMFLLARLHLDSLQDKISPGLIQRALAKLPRGPDAYEAAYKEAMARIENQMAGFRDLAVRALAWISRARRPLTASELQHALAIRVGSRSFHKEDVAEVALIASVCAGLVTVDENSNVIRLVHYTAQEFFDKSWKDWFPVAHQEIANACTTYLSYDWIRAEDFEATISHYPLYRYAAQNWGYHAQIQSVDETLALRVLQNQVKVDLAAQQLILRRYCCEECKLEGPKGISNLHLTAYFGLVDIAKALIQEGGDLTAKDNWGRSVLSWAAEHGQEELLECCPDSAFCLDHEDDLGMTPLQLAVVNGHRNVTKLLLARRDDHASEISATQVELMCEARLGNQGSVEKLLRQGVSPDFELGERTSLLLAVINGHQAVARMLLEHGANPDLQDRYGRSPLHHAVLTGDEGLVCLLLEFGADVNSRRSDDTVLLTAAAKGRDEIVRLLLAHDPQLDVQNEDGATALIEAVRHCTNETLDILLQNGPNLNLQDCNGGTPLICAAVLGQEEKVRLILAHNPQLDLRDCTRGTALVWAAKNGSSEMVDMLIQSGADLNIQDNSGQTALLCAIKESHESIAASLIRSGANVDQADDCGGFPLIWAVRNDLSNIASRLLQKGANLDLQDSNGGTALICAAIDKRDEIALWILTYGPQLDLKDNTGRTALIWAAHNGCSKIVELLLQSGADCGSRDNDGNTALIWAQRKRHDTITPLLLQYRAMVESMDSLGLNEA